MSIPMKETGVFGQAKATDAWNRELREGDLLAQGRGDHHRLFRLVTLKPSQWAGEMRLELKTATGGRDAIDTTDGELGWEIVARGNADDPVPERFEAIRQRNSKPVIDPTMAELNEMVTDGRLSPADADRVMNQSCTAHCDGCGVGVFSQDRLREGLVRGKPGAVCAYCASRATYPTQPDDEILECDTSSGCKTYSFPCVLSREGIEAIEHNLMKGGEAIDFVPVAWALAALCRPVAIDRAEAEAFALQCYAEFEKQVRDWLTGTNVVAVFDWGYSPTSGDRRPCVELSQPLLGEMEMFFDGAGVIQAIQAQVETWCTALAIRAMGKR